MKFRNKVFLTIVVLLAGLLTSLAVAISYTSDCPTAADLPAGADVMKAAQIHCYGSPDVVEYTDVVKPIPGETEVLVKILAAGVNPLDWHYMRGSPYIMRLGSGMGAPSSVKAGVDFSGIVESVGSKVTKFKPGDEVIGGRKGAFAEYIVIDQDRTIARKPESVSFEEAAAVPIAGLTALQALRTQGQVKPGKKVLINGASGGVGTYAVQIAKAFGAEVTAVCSTRNLEMVRALGADHVIDYKNASYVEQQEKYDLLIDMVGNHSVSKNVGVLDASGTLVIVGGPNGDWIGPLGGVVGSLLAGPFVEPQIVRLMAKLNQGDLETLADLMAQGKVTSQLDKQYPLSQVADAIRYSESGRARGKIILNINGGQ